jgi:hypothetical protein
MSMPGSQPIQTPEEQEFKNPRKSLPDNIPNWLKVFIKERVSKTPHHHVIVPATANHTAFILGAQPGKYSLRSLFRAWKNKKIHIISMIADREKVIDIEEGNNTAEGVQIQLSRLHWLDHSTLKTTTCLNQTVDEMLKFQKNLYEEFNSKKSVFYCHCMAGRSRSFVETMAFLYFYPDKEKLFDFGDPAWQKIKEKIPEDLQARLRDNPSFSDIAKFVKIQRPKVNLFAKLDSDQAGLLGLMALKQNVENPEIIQNRELTRLYEDARNIGLMLIAPLDSGFRDPTDRAAQEKNLVEAYKAYQKRGINLLTAMVVPIDKPISHELKEKEFDIYFNKRKPSEQARFAILLNKLEQQHPALNLQPLQASIHYAQTLAKKAKKLTAGDQVEFLKTFGSISGLDYKKVAKKILKGSGVDQHNAEIQLAELRLLAKKKEI